MDTGTLSVSARPRPPQTAEDDGAAMVALMRDLYPICRSITGNGTRQSLAIVADRIPMRVHEVPTGTPILDWTVPKEWNIREAYIATRDGRRVVDFADSNLHILQYSRAIDRMLPLAELQQHLHSLPETPDWIPYRTAYFADTWGFCLTQRQRDALTDPEYHVVIDATLEDGSLTYGELVMPGSSEDEVLFSCHSCHPSLANDNLSGIAVATMLARHIERRTHRFTYRFLFIPGMLGSLTWLARNEDIVPKVRHGLVLSCLGDPGATTYKKSRRGDAAIDRYVAHVLSHHGSPHRVTPFTPYGYDERQYCSPGFDMPVGCFMRSPNGTFPEYHTSADNLDFVRAECLVDSLDKLKAIVEVIEGDATYRSLNPKGEPQLGRRGLYGAISGHRDAAAAQMALLWTLNLADGRHTLLDVAERAGMPFAAIREAADRLVAAKLLEPAAA
jgi:aminopeptidase-like protein